MDIEISTSDGVVTIALKGKLNTVTSSKLDKVLSTALVGAKRLIFDFEGLEYVSSAGLRVLLEAYQIMSNQGDMKLLNVNDDILDVLSMTGFMAFLDVEQR